MRNRVGNPVRPFDHGDPCLIEIFFIAYLAELVFVSESIQIDMEEGEGTFIFVDERKGWARNLFR